MPPIETVRNFLIKSETIIKDTDRYVIICGDFNLTLDPDMDSKNYVNINNPRARNTLIEMMETYELIDAFRHFHPDTRRYTWRRRNPVKHARLD